MPKEDGSLSHGLFRIPGYLASLKSGKVKGDAQPKIEQNLDSVITVDGNLGYAPLSHEKGLPVLADAAQRSGIAVMRLINSFHFAALWPETEFLAERGLSGIACTVYKPAVAPAGASKAFFGTNPISFSWPRPNKNTFSLRHGNIDFGTGRRPNSRKRRPFSTLWYWSSGQTASLQIIQQTY